MYERFTDRSRKVMQLANQEAQRFNHEYVGTEHILLGLAKEGSGVAANVLKNLDIDLAKVRAEVEKIVQPGATMIPMGKLPQTPRTKQVLAYAIEEAKNLDHNYVGTEHLLLGLVREDQGIAAQVIKDFGVTADAIRAELFLILGRAPDGSVLPTTDMDSRRAGFPDVPEIILSAIGMMTPGQIGRLRVALGVDVVVSSLMVVPPMPATPYQPGEPTATADTTNPFIKIPDELWMLSFSDGSLLKAALEANALLAFPSKEEAEDQAVVEFDVTEMRCRPVRVKSSTDPDLLAACKAFLGACHGTSWADTKAPDKAWEAFYEAVEKAEGGKK